MAVAVQVAGLATIKLNVGEASALATLGYTENGAFITFQPYYQDVPGDERGGDSGPPVEKVYMGETARVRIELSKWDSAVAAKVQCRNKANDTFDQVAGYTPTAAGTLTFGGSKHYRLLIDTPTDPYNFLCAVPEEPFEINKGTKYSRLVFEFTCYADPSTGVLRNTSDT